MAENRDIFEQVQGWSAKTTVIINTDPEAIRRARSELQGLSGKFESAVKNAVNKTLDKTSTRVVRQLTEKLNAPATAIRESAKGRRRITVIPMGQESAFGGTVRILDRPINAINFRTKPTSHGISVQRWRDLPAKTYERGFIGHGINSNRLVFQRDNKSPTYRQKKAHHAPNIGKMRQHIDGIRGVSLYRFYKNHPQYGQAIREFAAREFPAQLDSQVDRFLGRRKSERTAP